MKVIYACYGGAHSSVMAAAIHLGWLASDRLPTHDEMLSIPRFDRAGLNERGRPEMMGRDEHGYEVYVLGRGPAGKYIERAVRSGFSLAGGDPSHLLIVSTLECVNLPMRIGGFTSRALGWIRLGRPIVLRGTERAFFDLVHIVETTKQLLRRREA